MSPSTKRIRRQQIRKRFDYRVILRIRPRSKYIKTGWGNGYVCLHPSHPCHSKEYDDIPVEVHGGLTYKRSGGGHMFPKVPNHYQVVGFDTAHVGDDLNSCPQEYVLVQAVKLHQQLIEMGPEVSLLRTFVANNWDSFEKQLKRNVTP